MASARQESARSRTLAAALVSRVSALSRDFTAISDPAQRQLIFEERQEAISELERMREAIEAGEQAVSDIRDEGRRANVPAGWLR